MLCTEKGFMVQEQFCSEWSELRDSKLVWFLCSESIDDWRHYLYSINRILSIRYLYNLYKDFCPLIGWIVFIIWFISTIYRIAQVAKHYYTPFGSARVQKLFTIALVHIYISRVFSISNTIFGHLLKDKANKKNFMQNSTRGKCNRRSACV